MFHYIIFLFEKKNWLNFLGHIGSQEHDSVKKIIEVKIIIALKIL